MGNSGEGVAVKGNFGQRFEGAEGVRYTDPWRKHSRHMSRLCKSPVVAMFLVCLWAARRPAWLDGNEWGESAGDEVRRAVRISQCEDFAFYWWVGVFLGV